MGHTVVIVDDHILIAKAITGMVENFANYSVLYEVENGKALTEKFRMAKNIPDIVLLDVSMPVMDGFETAKWLKEHHPDVLVMALSMQNEDLSLIKMIRAGAKGYLLKNIYPAELEKALNTLVARGHYFPEWAASRVFSTIAGAGDDRREDEVVITEREAELLKYCCTELTYKEIAAKMFCSNRTVEGYRDALFDKLNIRTRVGLAIYAIKYGYYVLK